MTEALKTALAYAARGWYVFPIQPKSKKPFPGFLWKQQSTNNQDQVAGLAEAYPGSNWALDCGKSNVVVVDVDDFFYVKKLSCELTSCFIVRTPRNGKHYYYSGNAPNSTGKLADKIDTRGVGGYVLIPGSIGPDNPTPYEIVSEQSPLIPLPQVLHDLLGKPRDNGAGKNEKSLCELDLPANEAQAVSYLQTEAPEAVQHEGGDHTTFLVACRLHDMAISEAIAFELMLSNWNEDKACPPWDWLDLRTKIRNAYKYCNGQSGNSAVAAMFPDIEEEKVKIPEKDPLDRFAGLKDEVFTLDKFKALDIPPKQKYLDPWLAAQTIIMVVGFRGCGKTWFVLSALMAVAKGSGSFGPWDVKESATVMYYDAEMVAQDTQERLILLGEKEANYGKKNRRTNSANGPGDIAGRVRNKDTGDYADGVRGIVGRDRTANRYHLESPFYIYSDALVTQKGFPRGNLLNLEWRGVMKGILLDLGVKVWAMDNISSLTPSGDESSKEAWAPINSWLLDLRFAGITTIFIHHTGKDGEQRGTSGREDNLDISITLKQPPGYVAEDGAKFIAQFTKSRIRMADLPKIANTQFQMTLEDGRVKWICENPKKERRLEVLKLKNKGLSSTEIAGELDCSKRYVNQVIKKAVIDGYLNAKGEITEKGNINLGINDPEVLFP